MAKRTKKLSKTLRLEALEQRQLLAGGFTTAQGQEFSDITHSNGNVYDQVLLKSSAITVTNDAGQITRVSFLDLNGDIVQAEFSGAGSLSISLDNYTGPAEAANYTQPDVKYVKGLASFTIQGSDATTNLSVFTVGTGTANNGANNPIFSDAAKQGGDHLADVARITVVADPANPNGSTFGGIRSGNAVFSADSGVVGISAANVQIQNRVIIGDINAKGSATPTLVFGTDSQFGDVYVAGGGLLSENGKAINNTGSYNFSLTLAAGTNSAGVADAAETTQSQLSFTGNNPVAVANKSLEFTAGVDTLVGAGGDDLFYTTTVANLGAFDSVSGGAGTDTVSIVSLVAVPNVNTFTMTGVESLNIKTAVGPVVQTTDGFSDLRTVKIESTDAATAITVTTDKNVTSVSTVGGTTVGITDNGAAGKDTLTTASVSGNSGLATITSDALTSLTVKGGAATVVAGAGTRALTVNLNGAAGVITDATATGVTVNATAAGTGSIITAAAAKAVTIGADNDISTTLTTGVAETLTVSGDSVATLTALTDKDSLKTVTVTGSAGLTATLDDQTALTTVNASGTSGKVTASINTGVTYTGGAGADTLTLVGATTKAITLGAGADTLKMTVLPAAGSVDAGDGVDSVQLVATDAAAFTANATMASKLSNFEKLVVESTTAAATINMDNADGLALVSQGTTTGGLTVNNVANASTIEFTGVVAVASSINMKDATGGSDSLTVKFTSSDAAILNTAATTIAAVETINIQVNDTKANDTAPLYTGALAIADTKTVTVSGSGGFDFTGSTVTAVTSMDASGVTQGAITFAAAKAASITGGAGDDVLVGSTGDDTIIGGAGNDTITTLAGRDSLTGGAGKDNFVISTPTSGQTYATITDLASADKITMAGAAGWSKTKISLEGTAVFQDYLDAATAGAVAANQMSWFQFNGDTYVVENVNAAATFQGGSDIVVKIAGAVDLSGATFAGPVLTI